jgi:hypothetical protein
VVAVARRLDVGERLVLLVLLAAVLSVVGLLVAGATVGTPAVNLPHEALIGRGEVPFMQTVKALGIDGGGVLAADHAQTPEWIVLSLVVGFGALWTACAVTLLWSSLRSDGDPTPDGIG